MSGKCGLARSPGGNGGLYRALRTQNILQDLEVKDIRCGWLLAAKPSLASSLSHSESTHTCSMQHASPHLQVFLTLSHYVRHACTILRGIEEPWGRKHIYRCTAFLNAKHFYDSYIISIPGLRSVPSLYVIFLPLFYIRHIIVYWKTI